MKKSELRSIIREQLSEDIPDYQLYNMGMPDGRLAKRVQDLEFRVDTLQKLLKNTIDVVAKLSKKVK